MNVRDFVLLGVLIDRCPSLLPLLQDHLDTYDELFVSYLKARTKPSGYVRRRIELHP